MLDTAWARAGIREPERAADFRYGGQTGSVEFRQNPVKAGSQFSEAVTLEAAVRTGGMQRNRDFGSGGEVTISWSAVLNSEVVRRFGFQLQFPAAEHEQICFISPGCLYPLAVFIPGFQKADMFQLLVCDTLVQKLILKTLCLGFLLQIFL